MNRLIHEKSPYLLQHAHNPVDWYPWGEEAFAKARQEDKPIFLSIGYSTCHWCHVMERESFESEKIAKIMNENFVSIKVDREERPDIDQIYMTAVQAMTGGGGWPLSAFLTHDLEPFFGGTYFPPDRRYGRPGFDEVLLEIARLWTQDRRRAVSSGQELAKHLKSQESTSAGEVPTEETLKKATQYFQNTFDSQEGGFGQAPKFPRSEVISLLLRIYRRTGEKTALSMATKTLDKMARGGIYDHLDGGFHRYSTDAQWLVPHFEKMLYDNALLAKSYLEAFQVDANPMWAGVARETLDYVLRDMTSPEGVYYSAEDADSEGVEGKFYVWSEKELGTALTREESDTVKTFFQTSPHGNFEGQNILHMSASTHWSERSQTPLAEAIKKLLSHRVLRIPPYKDDKVLVSWNCLMIGSMALASQVLEDPRYLKAAQRAANFILSRMWDEKSGGLKRRYRDGDVRFRASLDDYTFLTQSLLDLYEADFDERWYRFAVDLQKKTDELFWDPKGGYFFTDTSDSTLLTRTKEIYDGAVPSGNSVAALNLLRLYQYTLDDGYREKYQALSRAFGKFVETHPQASPALLMAVDFANDRTKEIVVAGSLQDPKTREIVRALRKNFIPNKVMALAPPGGSSQIPLARGKEMLRNQPTIYVCQGHTCQKPVHTWDEAEALLAK